MVQVTTGSFWFGASQVLLDSVKDAAQASLARALWGGDGKNRFISFEEILDRRTKTSTQSSGGDF